LGGEFLEALEAARRGRDGGRWERQELRLVEGLGVHGAARVLSSRDLGESGSGERRCEREREGERRGGLDLDAGTVDLILRMRWGLRSEGAGAGSSFARVFRLSLVSPRSVRAESRSTWKLVKIIIIN
jgi:hypothetical protein